MNRSALFSHDRRYRYELRRIWNQAVGPAMFVGLNPSTADEETDDPTVRRCIRFSMDWGYGGLVMTNLFAYRATDPKALRSVYDPVGPGNDVTLYRCADEMRTGFFEDRGIVIAAWGVHGTHLGRAADVIERDLLGDFDVLGLTRDGHPRHPLYLPAVTTPMNYRWAVGQVEAAR